MLSQQNRLARLERSQGPVHSFAVSFLSLYSLVCRARTTYTLIKLLTYLLTYLISRELVGWNIYDFVLVAQVISVHAEP